MTAIKPCLTCIHCYGNEDSWFHYCHKEEYAATEVNYVKGETWLVFPLCGHAREKTSMCGPEGVGWVEGKMEQPKRSLWDRVKNVLEVFGI